MSEKPPVLVEPLDARAAEDLDHLNNFVPESLVDAEHTADMLRQAYVGRESDVEDESLREELTGRIEAGVDMWKLSTDARQEQESLIATQNWKDLSAEQQAEMKRLKPDVYSPQGLAFAKLKEQAEKRLKLDDEIKAHQMEVAEQAAAEEAKQAAEQAVRDNYAKGHAAVRAEIDAAKADKEKEAFKLRMKYGSNMRPDVAAALESKGESAQSAKAPLEKRVIDPNVNKEQAHANSNATTEALRNFYRTQLASSETAGTAPTPVIPDIAPDAKTPPTLEAHGSFTNQDYLQYNDGETGLSFSEPGTQIVLGRDSIHKYARYFDENGGNMALVYTEGDGKYGIARGKVIDMRTGDVTRLPDDSLGFTVGDKFMLPGASEATVIEEVLLRHKVAAAPLMGAEQVDAPSPFKALDELLKDDPARSTTVMPAMPVAPATPAKPAAPAAALPPRPNAPVAPAPEKRKGRRALILAAGALALTAALVGGGFAANNAEDAPHKAAGMNTLDLKDDDRNKSDMNVEQGKKVSITVEADNGPTHEIKELAEEQGIKATPQQLYDTYKKFADQGRFDNIDGMYRMANGDFGFASAGAHELPADLVDDMLEDLKKSTS